MHHPVFLKSYFRRLIHGSLLLLLTAFLAFAFVTRGLEYIIVKSELERLGDAIQSVGMLKNISIVNSYDVTPGVEVISSSEYVASEDHRRYVSAMLHGMNNGDLDGAYLDGVFHSGREEVWFTGQVVSIDFMEDMGEGGTYAIHAMVETVLAGYPEYGTEGNMVTVYGAPPKEQEKSLDNLEAGDRILFRTGFYIDSPVVPGYVQMGGQNWKYARNFLSLKPLDGADNWYMLLGSREEPDWDNQEYAQIWEALEKARDNQRAVSLLTTSHMEASPCCRKQAANTI